MKPTLKYVTLIITLLLFAGYMLSAARAARSPQSQKSGHKGAAAKAESLYQQNCARCHGADGRGETNVGKIYGTPNLTDAALHARFSNKALAAIITAGKDGMPSFKKSLSRTEINALVAYVRRFKK
jgi:mono/diheme cytochrome c family protein